MPGTTAPTTAPSTATSAVTSAATNQQKPDNTTGKSGEAAKSLTSSDQSKTTKDYLTVSTNPNSGKSHDSSITEVISIMLEASADPSAHSGGTSATTTTMQEQNKAKSSGCRRIFCCKCFERRSQKKPFVYTINEPEELNVLISTTTGLLVVDYYDERCWMCNQRAKSVRKMAKRIKNSTVCRVHFETGKDLEQTDHCMVVFYKNGQEAKRSMCNEEEIRKNIEIQKAKRRLLFEYDDVPEMG